MDAIKAAVELAEEACGNGNSDEWVKLRLQAILAALGVAAHPSGQLSGNSGALTDGVMASDKTEPLSEALDDFDRQLDQWAQAYPLTVFPEPDLSKAREFLASGGMTLDSVSASNMRHVITTLNAAFNKVRAARGVKEDSNG